MLGEIQVMITRLYDLEVKHPVERFVCDESVARAAVGAEVGRGEVLMVLEEEDGVSVGLYVDPEVVEALASGEGDWLAEERFGDYCLAAEGVSHFVYRKSLEVE